MTAARPWDFSPSQAHNVMMQTKRRNQLLFAMLGLTLGQFLIVVKPAAAQDKCKVPLDATTKLLETPNHAYVTMNMGGKPETGESISVNGVIYAKYAGKWSAGMTTKEMKELDAANRLKNKTTCGYLKDELVNGEMAAVYSVHDVSPKSTSDSTIWISKGKGLPLKLEIDLDGGKSHVSNRFEYGDIKPPM